MTIHCDALITHCAYDVIILTSHTILSHCDVTIGFSVYFSSDLYGWVQAGTGRLLVMLSDPLIHGDSVQRAGVGMGVDSLSFALEIWLNGQVYVPFSTSCGGFETRF